MLMDVRYIVCIAVVVSYLVNIPKIASRAAQQQAVKILAFDKMKVLVVIISYNVCAVLV